MMIMMKSMESEIELFYVIKQLNFDDTRKKNDAKHPTLI